jgi:hypothetical protein
MRRELVTRRLALEPSAALRAVLDRYDVGGRLQHVREFVWRGGQLQFVAGQSRAGAVPDVWYQLSAEWPTAVLERRTDAGTALIGMDQPIVEGRWVRGSRRYELRVGIDMAVPTAIYVRSSVFTSHVPVVGRLDSDVELRLQRELDAYVEHFLGRHRTVPDATEVDAAELRRLGLA